MKFKHHTSKRRLFQTDRNFYYRTSWHPSKLQDEPILIILAIFLSLQFCVQIAQIKQLRTTKGIVLHNTISLTKVIAFPIDVPMSTSPPQTSQQVSLPRHPIRLYKRAAFRRDWFYEVFDHSAPLSSSSPHPTHPPTGIHSLLPLLHHLFSSVRRADSCFSTAGTSVPWFFLPVLKLVLFLRLGRLCSRVPAPDVIMSKLYQVLLRFFWKWWCLLGPYGVYWDAYLDVLCQIDPKEVLF